MAETSLRTLAAMSLLGLLLLIMAWYEGGSPPPPPLPSPRPFTILLSPPPHRVYQATYAGNFLLLLGVVLLLPLMGGLLTSLCYIPYLVVANCVRIACGTGARDPDQALAHDLHNAYSATPEPLHVPHITKTFGTAAKSYGTV